MESIETPNRPAPDHRRRGAFRLLFFALAAIGAGNTMLIAAVLPPMTRELGLPDWMAGAIFSLSAAIWTIASPFWGKRSNEWGRRPVMALGLAGYATSMLLFGVSGWLALNGYLQNAILIFVCLLASRTMFGLIGSGVNPAAQAYVADRTSREERQEEIASVTAGFSVGTVAGPAFAAAMVAVFGLLSPVFFTFFAAAAMSLMIWTRLPEQTKPVRPAKEFGEAKGLWRDPRVAPYLIFAAVLSLVTGVLMQTFVFAVIDKLGVSGVEAAQYTGPAFSVGAMATLMAQLIIIPRLKLSNQTLMMSGAAFLCVGALLVVPTSQFAVLIIAQFAIGLGQGLARPGFFSGASLAVGPALQGNVAGLVMACNGVGFVISPFFGPWIYENVDRSAPFLIAAGLLVGMIIFARFTAKAGDQPGAAVDDTVV
ncbi:MAG: MFS transporter [Pseudomonadota bacterium]